MKSFPSYIDLQNRLRALLEVPMLGARAPAGFDAIVSPNEVNQRHGTGILLKRMFGAEPNVLSVRSQTHYEGDNHLKPGLVISHAGHNRPQAFARVARFLGNVAIRRVVCVPYFCDDLITAIALKDAFGVSLCTYLMDDNNVVNEPPSIPDDLMAEALAKSRLRLAISEEMCDAYETKFGVKVWFVPPVVPAQLVRRVSTPVSAARSHDRGVLVGNIWDRQWLELLRSTIRGSGFKIDWYCNRGNLGLPFDDAELQRDGIFTHLAVGEELLAKILPGYAFALMPTGRLTEASNTRAIARLSLPSRICYISACSHIPILVLGHKATTAARFVARTGIGMCVDYQPAEFVSAVRHMCQPEVARKLRENAARIAGFFSDEGMAEWIWASLERGQPVDDRFEHLSAGATAAAA